jgi:hypothetical protein
MQDSLLLSPYQIIIMVMTSSHLRHSEQKRRELIILLLGQKEAKPEYWLH